MSKFFTVFKFEFVQQIKKRTTIVSTILLSLIVFVLAAAPAIFNKINKPASIEESNSTQYLNESIPAGYYVSNEDIAVELNLDRSLIYKNENDLIEAVKQGKEKKGYAIYDYDHFKTYYHDKSILGGNESIIYEVLKEHLISKNFEKEGLDYTKFLELQNISINMEEEILGRDASSQYFLAFAYVVTLYMVIIMFGNIVAVAVAREKDSRTMELLITTTDPKNLIIGKVLAVTCASLIQMAMIILSGVISFIIFKNFYPQNLLTLINMMLDLSMLGMYIFYFVLGLLLYMFIFAALGSVVSRMEDVSSAISPIMFLFILSYIVAMLALQGLEDSIIVKIASWIPFFSVMVMPILNAITSVSLFQIVGSTLLTVLFIYLFSRLSVRIYRWGTLNYGNKPNFFKVCKEVLFTKQ